MEITLTFIFIYNLINILLIGIFATNTIIKAYREIISEGIEEEFQKKQDIKTGQMFLKHIKKLRRKFWISFTILELSLISYFVFWGLLFYFKSYIVIS